MKIALNEASDLAMAALTRGGFSGEDARVIAEQTVGCEIRGASEGGLSRVLSIIETYRMLDKHPGPMTISRETPVSAHIDGGDQLGYRVADRAISMACDKAHASGIGIVGASNTWYTGMYVHYMEKVARQGLVAICCGSSSPRVAPHGSSEGRFGTNPIAFAFPSDDEPIVLDFATSGIIVADAVLASRTDGRLPDGVAWDKDGNATTDPVAALAGAFAVWGGHRGSGLAIAIQLLGILCGGGAMPDDYKDCGFLAIAVRPNLFMDEDEFRRRVSAYAETIRTARRLDPDVPIRMPFDRSAEFRRKVLTEGAITVDPRVLGELRRFVTGNG